MKTISVTFQKSMYLLLTLLFLIGMLPMLPAHASTPTPPIQLDLTQLASNGNGKVTFQILNPPSEFDFSSLTATASWDNSNWVYAIWYEGGCPTACVVEWVGVGVPFYIKLTNQNSSITFNETVNGGAFSTPYTQLDLQQLSSNGNGRVTFQILNPPSGFDFSSLTTAGASWDNSTWVYAIWYEGGCPTACVVEWSGQTTTPFYVKVANQITSIIFNQAVSPIPNAPPVADAGLDQTVLVNALVTLDGSGSFDSDSDPLTFSWAEDAANPETGLLSDPSAVSPSFTPTIAGLYQLTLVVNDRFVDSDPDPVSIVVQSQSEAIQGLIDLVEGIDLQQGVEHNLDAKLEAALQALDDLNENNDAAAINTLQAFINAVEAQRGRELTDPQADELVAAAQAIIDSLSV